MRNKAERKRARWSRFIAIGRATARRKIRFVDSREDRSYLRIGGV